MKHPGLVLLQEYMQPNRLSQYRLAVDIGVSPRRINQIVHGERAITADTALRLARYFGTEPTRWMTLQAQWDLARARERLPPDWEDTVRVFDAAAPRPGRGRPRKQDAPPPPVAARASPPAELVSDYLFIDEL